ncbi:MAG: hypothetical protein H8E74_09820 [Gammaproteobacteria bacterium]|nr:hypothetical protein [Gammaproteobacteria bacterium]
MKNKRIVRRKRLVKMEKKRLQRNERRKNVKQHDINIVKPKKENNTVPLMGAANAR